jgi:hypothetical protein
MKTRVCPIPEPDQLDCPLYDQRIVTPGEALRRAVLMERRRDRPRPDLAALIRGEAESDEQAQSSRPPQRDLPPPNPVFSPVFNQRKENTP